MFVKIQFAEVSGFSDSDEHWKTPLRQLGVKGSQVQILSARQEVPISPGHRNVANRDRIIGYRLQRAATRAEA